MSEPEYSGRGPRDYLETIEKLLEAGRGGDEATFFAYLDELTLLREHSLFQDIGRLTRQLHDALKSFQIDPRVEALAKEEFPDARHRLDQVVAMTEESAHKTMDLVEEALPLTEGLSGHAESLSEAWARFRRREMSAKEFNGLVRDTTEFLRKSRDDNGKVRGNLSEVLLAQNFQDLSGQTIRKVVRLVQEVESTLIDMIRLSGQASEKVSSMGKDGDSPPPKKSKKAEELKSQDEVDDLLSSLGF